MARETKRKFAYGRWIFLAIVVGLAVLLFQKVLGRPSFDPDKVAEAETRMWQAYYSGDKMQLGLGLIGLKLAASSRRRRVASNCTAPLAPPE